MEYLEEELPPPPLGQMNRFHQRGVISDANVISAGSRLGLISSCLFCFKCFFSALIEPRMEEKRSPLILPSDPSTVKTTGQEECVLWLKDIRPARNWIEQNVVILPENGRSPSSNNEVNPPSRCERHGDDNPGVRRATLAPNVGLITVNLIVSNHTCYYMRKVAETAAENPYTEQPQGIQNRLWRRPAHSVVKITPAGTACRFTNAPTQV
ncbi:hypothetical protein Aperf_G00000086927 [Anoplocephala perfoliata]